MKRHLVSLTVTLLVLRSAFLHAWWNAVAALVVLSLAIAYLLHIFVEKPSLKIRDRLARSGVPSVDRSCGSPVRTDTR